MQYNLNIILTLINELQQLYLCVNKYIVLINVIYLFIIFSQDG